MRILCQIAIHHSPTHRFPSAERPIAWSYGFFPSRWGSSPSSDDQHQKRILTCVFATGGACLRRAMIKRITARRGEPASGQFQQKGLWPRRRDFCRSTSGLFGDRQGDSIFSRKRVLASTFGRYAFRQGWKPDTSSAGGVSHRSARISNLRPCGPTHL